MKTIQELLDSAGGDIDAIDTSELTTDQLKELLQQHSGATEPQPQQQAQPRDEKGQFKAAEAAEDPAEDADDDAEVVYRREIDLGDGAGKEVFEAPTIEELLDKIVTAKANATKKIREQEARLKELTEQKKVNEQTDKDDEFVLSQDMLSRPTDAVKKAFKKATGIDITEVKSLADRVKALTDAQSAQTELDAQNAAATAFVAEHPEYVANQANGARLSRAINLLIAEVKHSGQQVDYPSLLLKAYTDLNESGLLELRSPDAEATAEVKAPTGAEKTRIGRVPEDVAPTQRTVRRSSSLTSRANAGAAPKNTEPSEDDLYTMPLDKLKELANRGGR